MKFVSRFIISTTSTVKINCPYYKILPAIELLRLCLCQMFLYIDRFSLASHLYSLFSSLALIGFCAEALVK